MPEQILSYWQKLTFEQQYLLKLIGIASILLYVVLQFITFLLPIVITVWIGLLAYKKLINKTPKVLK